jgi:hypothetical protein
MGYIDPEPHEFSFQAKIEWVSEQIPDVAFKVDHTVMASVYVKQPSDVPPDKVDPRGVWIGLVIAMLVMHTVHCDPTCRGVLKGTDSTQGDKVFEPFGAFEPSVGQ